MSNTPLSEHALLSDCRLAALVTTAGSVDWLCLPHFDSPPVLARLPDNEAGHFLIAPAGAASPTRQYYRHIRPGPGNCVGDRRRHAPRDRSNGTRTARPRPPPGPLLAPCAPAATRTPHQPA